jgi:hypothetical protein
MTWHGKDASMAVCQPLMPTARRMPDRLKPRPAPVISRSRVQAAFSGFTTVLPKYRIFHRRSRLNTSR